MDTPAFASTPRASGGKVDTADASRTAPATFATIFTAGARGSRIERLKFTGLGATVQSVMRFFLFDPAGGGTWHPIGEVQVGPVPAPGATQPVWEGSMEAVSTPEEMPLLLPPLWQLRASINDTQAGGGVYIAVTGGDF